MADGDARRVARHVCSMPGRPASRRGASTMRSADGMIASSSGGLYGMSRSSGRLTARGGGLPRGAAPGPGWLMTVAPQPPSCHCSSAMTRRPVLRDRRADGGHVQRAHPAQVDDLRADALRRPAVSAAASARSTIISEATMVTSVPSRSDRGLADLGDWRRGRPGPCGRRAPCARSTMTGSSLRMAARSSS